MTFDLERIMAGKRAFRRDLAARPIAEKLRILDALREREVAIRGRRFAASAETTPSEEPPRYRPGAK